MAVRDILEIGHPLLAERANEVPIEMIGTAELNALIDDMIDTMRAANGAGLAANQIGETWRVFVIEIGDNPRYPYKPKVPLTVVINPKIEVLSELSFTSNEGCLSVPQMRGEVERSLEIKVQFYNPAGERVEQVIKGYSACTWQHEYDHLDGVLFVHRVQDPTTFTSWKVFKAYREAGFAKRVAALVKEWGS